MITQWTHFGERCSGTKYVHATMVTNWKTFAHTYDFGYKHWTVPSYPCKKEYEFEAKYHRNIIPLDDPKADETLFIVIFRNPLDWIQSFFQNPDYLPDIDFNKGISHFIRSEIVDDVENDSLKWNLPYRLYERSNNIVDLRNKKNAYFWGFKDRVKHCAIVFQETFMEDIARIRDKYELAERFGDGNKDLVFPNYHTPKTYDLLSEEDLKFISSNLDNLIDHHYYRNYGVFHPQACFRDVETFSNRPDRI